MPFLLKHVFLTHVSLFVFVSAVRIVPEAGHGLMRGIVDQTHENPATIVISSKLKDFSSDYYPADNEKILVEDKLVVPETDISDTRQNSATDFSKKITTALYNFQNISDRNSHLAKDVLRDNVSEFKSNIIHKEENANTPRTHDSEIDDDLNVAEKVTLKQDSEHGVDGHFNAPPVSDLKLSPSYSHEINSLLIPKISSDTTETNDILPQSHLPNVSSTSDHAVPLTTMKASTNMEVSSVEPLSILSSKAPPKLKPKSPVDKKPEAKVNSIEDKWRDLEKKFRTYTDTVMKRALPKFLRIHSQLNISSQCNGALLQMARGLRSLKSWAIKMVDASGRLPSGSLEGTLTDLGDYDQCLDVAQPQRSHHSAIRGQYCTLELKPTLPALHNSVTLNTKVLDFGNASKDSVLSDLSHGSALFHFMVLRIGICVPSPCVADDIRELASALLKKVPIQVSVRNCETKQGVHISIPQFIVITIAVILGCLIVAGTCIDGYVSKNLTKTQEIGKVPQSLLAFSLRANIRQLFKSSRKSSTLLSVNGIRCLSLMWIVLAHTYGFGHRQGLARLSHAKTYMDDVFFQIITNAWVSVDTFFLLGGLLVAYSNLKSMENSGGTINFLSHVLHRIWRLTPPLAGTLGVMFLLPLIGSGPLWADMVGQKVANCEKRWWQIFLPMNTWIDFGSMCLLHTWYIAADMHFYCLAPLALIVLYRWPVFGFALLFLLTAACSLVTGLLTIANDLPPTVIFFSPDVELTKRTANLIYFRPYPHIGAYCVGLALGYILWRYRKISLKKLTLGAGWALSSTSCLAVLFATYSWSRGHSADPAEGVTYAVLHRTVWAAGVAWVLFVCATGHGGVLNKFLSWQLFVPLSKLCYSVYLLHFPVLWVRVSWRRSLLNFHHYDIVTEFFGILMITLGLSIIFHLTFEAPFLKLEQIWFPERGKSTKIVKPLDEKIST